MLIIPFDRPIDWRRPPVITFALVAANVLAFLLFQLDDGREMRQVKEQYYESGLAGIELPRYRAYLQRRGAERFLQDYGDRIDDASTPWFRRLLGDGDFQQRLRAERVIGPGEPDYREWRRERERFADRLDATTVWGHGLRPAEPAPASFLSHMFLHGGPVHLVGNMIFLIAVGLLVEVALGSLLLTGLYLLSGLGAAALFIALNPGTVVPMVGASGAIAGLMGLCGVLYGLRRIRFFYFVGIYFDYVKAPALLLLGLWLGKEVFQYLRFADGGTIAYTAHIGGIATGALAGAAVRFGTSAVDEEALDEGSRDEVFQQRLAEAHDRLDAMEPDRARPLFERLARDYPDAVEALDGLFRACRFAPGSEAYHTAAQRILRLDTADEAAADLVLAAFRDYRERARPGPRLGAATMSRMIDLLLRRGSPQEVAPLVRAGLKHPTRFPEIADQAVRLASRLQRADHHEPARTLYRHVIGQFPGTEAARTAERALGMLWRPGRSD